MISHGDKIDSFTNNFRSVLAMISSRAITKSYHMAKKTKAIVKSQGSEHHDEEEEEPLPKIMYTRPPPLPFKCPVH